MRSNNSICNLILSSSSVFLKFWLNDKIREVFLSCLDQEELPKLRFVCHDWSHRIAARLFRELHIRYKSSTFIRPSRVAALERIGYNVQQLTFSAPHTPETNLAPLVNPETGEEADFVYTPQVQSPQSLTEKFKHPKYGSWELADLLVKQYPPLFHASTNVPSFVRALSALFNLSHLKISCPNETNGSLGRRSTVDFALISLRIAIERAPLDRLDSISFLPIHPNGLFYMQPVLGFGVSPKSLRRWARIKKMKIVMQSFDTDRTTRSGQLKTLHSYLRGFATTLTQFYFKWQGAKGPSPISLDSEPDITYSPNPAEDGIQDDKQGQSKPKKGLTALNFTALHQMELENAVMDATQISAFICQHRKTLEEFKFEHIKLRSGDWDEALSPLARMGRRAEKLKRQEKREEQMSMDVPLMLSTANMSELVINHLGTNGEGEEQRLLQKSEKQRISASLGRLLSRRASKAKEQIIGGSEQMKNFLKKNSILPRRL